MKAPRYVATRYIVGVMGQVANLRVADVRAANWRLGPTDGDGSRVEKRRGEIRGTDGWVANWYTDGDDAVRGRIRCAIRTDGRTAAQYTVSSVDRAVNLDVRTDGRVAAQHTVSSVDRTVDVDLAVDVGCRLARCAVEGRGATRRSVGTVGCVVTQGTVGTAG
jgi:hypothetical protein